MFSKNNPISWFDRIKAQQPRLSFLSPEKISRLLIDHPELRLSDDPAAMLLIQMAMRDPDDADIQEMLQNMIQEKRLAYLASGNAYWGNNPAAGQIQYPPHFIKVGKTSTGIDMGLGYNQLPLNTVILGPTGKGKTTTLKAMLLDPHLLQTVCIIMLVKKPEWRGFLMLPQLAGLVRILQLGDLAIAFSQPPQGVTPAIWHNDLSKFTGQSYDRVSAYRLMNETLHELTGQFSTLKQLIAAIGASKVRFFSRRADLKESMISCLKDLQLSVGDIFEYSSSTFLDELFSRPGLTVIEMMTLPPEHLGFLATYLTRYLYSKRLYEGTNSMVVVFVIDDATVNVNQARDKSNPGGVAPIPESMIMGRALNMGYILLVHDYSSLSEIIRQNIETLVIQGLPGESSYLLRNNFDFTEEQIQGVKSPSQGQAVLINRGLWSKPVLIYIEKPDIPETCPDALVRQAAEAFLSQVKTMPPYKGVPAASPRPSAAGPAPAPTPMQTASTLDPKHLDFLLLVAQTPPMPLSRIYQQLGLSNSEGRRIVNKLIALGLIVLHALATGRRGGKVQLPEVTETGWTVLEQNGHHKPKDNGQGSWLHKITAALIGAEGKSQQETVTFEVTLDGCRIDVLRVNSATHQRTFYNIGLSTQSYEAQAIVKFFATAAAAGAAFVLVTETTTFAEKVLDCLKQTDEGRNVLNRFTTRLVGSFVEV